MCIFNAHAYRAHAAAEAKGFCLFPWWWLVLLL